MTRFVTSVSALLLCGSVLSGCASDKDILGDLGHPKVTAASDDALPSDLDSGVRQAQMERVAGQYDQAIHTLSQLMLVASDDPRVVGEYGKTLVEQGRAHEAVQFLSRASELQPKDWTLFSALGVAYDELGQEGEADKAYDRALLLSPHESSVLNNYALSRMMANDPVRARQLMAEAEQAGGSSDPKIARNIALVKSLPDAPVEAPKTQAVTDAAGPAPATAAPHSLAPVEVKPLTPAPVVMEQVPADPLAAPAKPRLAAAKAKAPEAVKASDTVPAKNAIPELRETASAY